MTKYICPFCGAEGYSASDKTPCHKCGKTPCEHPTCKGCEKYKGE